MKSIIIILIGLIFIPFIGFLAPFIFLYMVFPVVHFLKLFGLKPSHLTYADPLRFKKTQIKGDYGTCETFVPVQNFPAKNFYENLAKDYNNKNWLKLYFKCFLLGSFITLIHYGAEYLFLEKLSGNAFFVTINEDGDEVLSIFFWATFILILTNLYYLMDWLFSAVVLDIFGDEMRTKLDKELIDD